MFGRGIIKLIISNEEVNDIMKIFKSLEEPGSLIKRISEKIENRAKEKRGVFLSKLLSTSGATLLGNLLTVKGTIRASESTIRAGHDFQCLLILQLILIIQ